MRNKFGGQLKRHRFRQPLRSSDTASTIIFHKIHPFVLCLIITLCPNYYALTILIHSCGFYTTSD